jgi:hypothetical protein
LPDAEDKSSSKAKARGMARSTQAVLAAIVTLAGIYAAFSGNIKASIENTLAILFPSKPALKIRSVDFDDGVMMQGSYVNSLRMLVHKDWANPVSDCSVDLEFPSNVVKGVIVDDGTRSTYEIGYGSQDKDILGRFGVVPTESMENYFRAKASGTRNEFYKGGREQIRLRCDGVITDWFEVDLQPPIGFGG